MTMFRALNSFISRLDAEPPSGASQGRGQAVDGPSYGFQVLKNSSAELPIEPWFDFVVGINGRPLDSPDPNLFATEIRNCAGKSVSLEIWRAKVKDRATS